ncbi:hypothetical protein [Maridesulfovibrio salexigens]|uniref:Uncharacterized protein n=1 Tax=Maridesulfovibrio salexigens (strain ATCC 14822 / DSM 2638 / NCIMB 8403 / VKM B-1763) TaxID=526222 RepID=C6BZ89_MARSD|nr:hypothetical protein [Maridesulfovibrio salexigens]ACS78913.1 hypothetical protein Desal_0847 [Maridesulfovibrio salexigens DSM 2638]
MQINSNAQSSVGSFNFRARQEEIASRKVEEDSAKTSTNKSVNGKEELTVITPVEWEKIELRIAGIVDEKSNELQSGLEKIFKEGNENVLSGKSGLEYDKHIKELTAAIEGQDYKNAERIIDKFFTGDKDKVIEQVQNLANSVKDSFWNKMRDSFKEMYVAEHRTTYDKGEDPESALPYVQRAIERAKKASAEYDINDKNLAKRVSSTISTGAEQSKGNLKNAGRNRYSETAESVTHATAQHARDNIFGGDENSRQEDKDNTAAAYERINDEIASPTQAMVDKLNKANKSKKDDFSKYLFESGEAYFEALRSELGVKKLSGKSYTTVEDEQAYQDSLKSNPVRPKHLGNIELGPMPEIPMTLALQDSVTQQALYSPVKVTELYGTEEEEQFGNIKKGQLSDFSGWA